MTEPDIHREAARIGLEILEAAPPDPSGLFNRQWWYGQIMDWAMRDEKFKVQMFRFVDVLPSLRTDREVTRHIEEYFTGLDLPPVLKLGVKAAGGGVTGALAAKAIRSNVIGMARRFIAGADARDALGVLRRLREQGMGFTLDLLGEACLSDAEADEYERRYLELIDTLSSQARTWKHLPRIDQGAHGPDPRVNVSLKLTALHARLDPIDPAGSSFGVRQRLRPLFRRARESGAFLNVDMEHYQIKDLTLKIFRELMDEEEFQDFPNAGIVIQAYLVDAEKDLAELIDWAQRRPHPITVRLVKGAYWDMETVTARQQGWPVPVFVDKGSTDASYERCARMLLDAYPRVRTAFASHNVRSLAAAIALARTRGLPDTAYEVQALHGMADPIKAALVRLGFRVREYVPIGELILGMAYLVRRLLENTSNESWLRRKFADGQDPEALLAAPRPGSGVEPAAGPLEPPAPDAPPEAFRNQPPLQLHLESERERFAAALERVRSSSGKTLPVVVNGRAVETGRFIDSLNPASPGELIARVHAARGEDVDAAVASAQAALGGWRRLPVRNRGQVLFTAAELIRRWRYDLAALVVLEVGKGWRESDVEVCQAIDYLEYYGREAVRLGQGPSLLSPPGESNRMVYQGRGPTAVIAGRCSPLAAPTGMIAAALAAGNPVMVKPAEESPAIAARVTEILWEAGVPREALHFLPGYGEEVGARLVEHPGVEVIAFSGSKRVGQQVLEAASRVRPGQRRSKQVVAQMDGQASIIVDSDADLDEAIKGVLGSASACRGREDQAGPRVIVVGDAFEDFTRRLALATSPAASGAPAEGVPAVVPAEDFATAVEIANQTPYSQIGAVFSRSPANLEYARERFQAGNLHLNRGIGEALVGRQGGGGFSLSTVGFKIGGPDYLFGFMEARVITENTIRRGFAPPEE